MTCPVLALPLPLTAPSPSGWGSFFPTSKSDAAIPTFFCCLGPQNLAGTQALLPPRNKWACRGPSPLPPGSGVLLGPRDCSPPHPCIPQGLLPATPLHPPGGAVLQGLLGPDPPGRLGLDSTTQHFHPTPPSVLCLGFLGFRIFPSALARETRTGRGVSKGHTWGGCWGLGGGPRGVCVLILP